MIIAAVVLLPITMTALDSDGDILPDAWEDSHSMDKNDHEDASIDFDRDRLSALEEFQLQAEGLGEGPLGKWTTELVNLDFMNRPGSSNNRKEIIDFNDRGDILVNVTSWTPVWGTAPTYYHRVWFFNGSDSTWRKLSTVAGQEASLLVARDLNNEGIIVGQARAAAANGGVAFGFMKDMRAATFDESVAPWLDAETASVGDLTGINDFGEVIGVDAAGSSFFQSPTEGTVHCPPGWVTPVFTAINNWGEVAGVEYTDYWGLGAPRHFLMTPGWHWLTDFPAFDMWLLDPEDSGLADSFGADFRPTWINDWGEFTGNYWIETENQWWNGSWYFDGSEHDATMSGTDPVVRYRNLLPESYTHQTVRGLNNWPQILVSGSTNSVEEDPEDFDVFLVNGTQRVALSALSSVPAISDHTYEKSMPVAINNRGTIIGWANFGNSLYLLTLDQDRDGDGMSNDWETFHGLDPDDPSDALDDPDGDGACNLAEFRLGTRPTSNGYRLALDSDADGLPDAWERKMFGNLSANPAGDEDEDGLDNWEEWVIGSDPHLWDSDGDGWDDFEEFFIRGTDASNADTDGDGIPDLVEDLAGSDPKDPDDRPRFPPYLRIEVKTVTNSELIPDEFVTPYFDYWAVHWPLFPEYNEYFSSALATLSWADKLSDPYGDQYPHKITRLVCDYPGTEDYHLKVLRIAVIDGEGGAPPQISVEAKEFKIPAGQKVSNEIETVAVEVGGVSIRPVELGDINDHADESDDVAIVPWDTTKEIQRANIAWIDAHSSHQDPAPRMPQLTFRVPGLPAGLTIEAKLSVDYERPYGVKQAEDAVKIPANGNFVQVNGDRWEIYNEADWQTELTDRGFFGGNAKLTYQIKQGENIVVAPEEIDFSIGGENPADDRCKEYTQSRLGAPWYAYAVEKHESQAYNPGFYNQFWERSGNSSPINGGINYEFTLGDPLQVLSPGETGVGGTGLAQVTGAGGNKNSPAARAVFWNWQQNVDAFLAIQADKIQIAETFMNDQTPRTGPGSMPNGQRPQTTFHTGQNVPVPSRDQANVTFGDNQGEKRPEDAVAIKAYNGASAHWCSWRGPAVHEWQWNYGQNNYVERVCEQVEEEEE